MSEIYTTVKIKTKKINQLIKALDKKGFKLDSNAEAVYIAINDFLLKKEPGVTKKNVE